VLGGLRCQAGGVSGEEGVGRWLAGGEGDGGGEIAVRLAEGIGDGVNDLDGGEVLGAGDDEPLEWARGWMRGAQGSSDGDGWRGESQVGAEAG